MNHIAMLRVGYPCLFLAVAACVGCHTTDPSIASLEAECRQLEDVVWEFKYDNDMLALDLESCRRENDALRRELADGPGSSGSGTPDIDIDLGIPLGRGGATQDNLASDDAVLDTHVTHIVLNPRLTGGYDFDRESGDEGVMAVIEPRNAAGEYVSMTGPISVVVVDPLKSGSEARIARWDYSGREANRLIKDSLLGKGIHMELPWPNDPPENSNLRLFVRYTTIDDRTLETEYDFRVTTPGAISSHWTPSALSQEASHDFTPPADLSAMPSVLAERNETARENNPSPVIPADYSPQAATLPNRPEANRETPPEHATSSSPQLPQWQPYR